MNTNKTVTLQRTYRVLTRDSVTSNVWVVKCRNLSLRNAIKEVQYFTETFGTGMAKMVREQ